MVKKNRRIEIRVFKLRLSLIIEWNGPEEMIFLINDTQWISKDILSRKQNNHAYIHLHHRQLKSSKANNCKTISILDSFSHFDILKDWSACDRRWLLKGFQSYEITKWLESQKLWSSNCNLQLLETRALHLLKTRELELLGPQELQLLETQELQLLEPRDLQLLGTRELQSRLKRVVINRDWRVIINRYSRVTTTRDSKVTTTRDSTSYNYSRLEIYISLRLLGHQELQLLETWELQILEPRDLQLLEPRD